MLVRTQIHVFKRPYNYSAYHIKPKDAVKEMMKRRARLTQSLANQAPESPRFLSGVFTLAQAECIRPLIMFQLAN